MYPDDEHLVQKLGHFNNVLTIYMYSSPRPDRWNLYTVISYST